MVYKSFIVIAVMLLYSCDSPSPSYDSSLPSFQSNALPAPAPIMFKVEAVYPHDPAAFTQGLEFHNGKLYEGTGEKGTSNLRIVNIKSGKVEKNYLIPDKSIFGEGITVFKNQIYQLTWQSHKIFVYHFSDITHPVDTFNWDREGWGATNDGNSIIISDGSSKLFFVQPDAAKKEMTILKVLTVADNLGEVDSLNELELIDGYVYANIWLTDDIVKIDTSNGHVVGKMNLAGLLRQYDPGAQVSGEAVLNGIAYDSTSRNLYITGKFWPKMFEIKLN